MDSNIEKLVRKGILIAGVLKREDDGFVSGERINDVDEILRLEKEGHEIYFATKSMGRSIFILNQDGQVENYKGVDSGLGGYENFVTGMTDTRLVLIDNPVSGKKHTISLRTEPGSKGGRRSEVRFKGTSPLEDLEEEADVNEDLKKMGVKVPRLKSVREYSKERSFEWGLPVHVEGDYSELEAKSSYAKESRDRKEKIKNNPEIVYVDELKEGTRPELLIEYFERLGLTKHPDLIDFIKEEGKLIGRELTVEQGIASIDKSYSLGQRYGQAVRILESPFRIADIEGYIKAGDKEALDVIAEFTELTTPECKNGECFETVFVRNLGTNMAKLMSGGWMFKNFAHRQDYSLAGEMCDDSYESLEQAIQNMLENEKDKGKAEGMISQYNRYYRNQVIFASSMVKILQDSMRVRGKSEQEIESLLDIYTQSFSENLDLEKMSGILKRPADGVLKGLMDFCDTTKVPEYDRINIPEGYDFQEGKRDYVLEIATIERPVTEYDDSVINANYRFRDFYAIAADKLREKLKYRMLSNAYRGNDLNEYDLNDAAGVISRGMEGKGQQNKNNLDEK